MQISKILVTGGAGYIGSHVVESLQKHGYQVIVLDNLYSGKKQNLPPNITFIKASILSINALRQAFTQYNPDAVIHLAALKAAGESMVDAISYSDTNIIGTINVLKVMLTHKVKYFVFSSSAAVYGEPQYLPIDEEHILSPTNYYGATKLIMENIIRWYSKVYELKYTTLRYFNAAGHMPYSKLTIVEPDPQNLIPIVLEVATGKRKKLQIFGNDYATHDGTCVRDYIHVCDLAEAHVLSLKYMEQDEESLELNLGTGKGYSVQEIYNAACQITQQTIPMEYTDKRFGDSAELYAKSVLAHKKLKWIPQYTNIETILQHSWNAYLKHAKLKK